MSQRVSKLFSISLPPEHAEWLNAQPNKSKAVQALIAKAMKTPGWKIGDLKKEKDNG